MKLATTLALIAAFTLPIVAQRGTLDGPTTSSKPKCDIWHFCQCPKNDPNGCGIFDAKLRAVSLYEAALNGRR